MKTGIYFLIKCDEIIYIGKTTQFPIRLKYHKLQKMGYETVKFIECAESKLDEYERRWIIRFKPKFNSTHKPKEAYVAHDRTKSKIFKKPMKFRKLTEKSFIGFGSFKDTTVARMLQTRRMELVHMYFNLSHITFFDNILEELKISSQWRIEKPGTDYDKYFDFCQFNYPEWVVYKKEKSGERKHRGSINTLAHLTANSHSKQYNANFNKGNR